MTELQQIAERMERYGRDGKDLTIRELLVMILGKKTADKLVKDLSIGQFKSGEGIMNLRRMSTEELSGVIGKAGAKKLIAVLEFSRRAQTFEGPTPTKITCATDVYNSMHEHLKDLAYEEFWILLMNRQNNIIKKVKISQGGVSGTVADPKLIFSHALAVKASSMILVHNHPSGNRQPSQADIQLTKNIKKSGELLEISVLDHLIYTDRTFFSFSDEGLI